MDIVVVESKCRAFITDTQPSDRAHAIEHIERVVRNTRFLTGEEGARAEVTVPAAWLHDCVALPKNSPDRTLASTRAAEVAVSFLSEIGYPQQLLPSVFHAIAAHSFSAGIRPESLEAKVVQDADRLDALGAIGLVRCVEVGSFCERRLYQSEDPFWEHRTPDDEKYTLDHFPIKLFKLPEMMNTASGGKEAERRAEFLKSFLEELKREIA